MGHLRQMPPFPLWRNHAAMLLIKILNFMSDQDQLSYTTHENMHILLALITNSPEIKVN